jgi:hypothetical protein
VNALDIAAETTTCLELLSMKKFDDCIRSHRKALGGRKGASWRKISWSLFESDEVASFRQKFSWERASVWRSKAIDEDEAVVKQDEKKMLHSRSKEKDRVY